jgi:hypothetical protein
MRSKLISGRIRAVSFLPLILLIIIVSVLTNLLFDFIVDERVKSLENASTNTQTEPYTEFNQEVALCYPLADYERAIAEKVVMAEASNQSLLGQMTVAQVILDRAVLWD